MLLKHVIAWNLKASLIKIIRGMFLGMMENEKKSLNFLKKKKMKYNNDKSFEKNFDANFIIYYFDFIVMKRFKACQHNSFQE